VTSNIQSSINTCKPTRIGHIRPFPEALERKTKGKRQKEESGIYTSIPKKISISDKK
jgi:hypothetical protein